MFILDRRTFLTLTGATALTSTAGFPAQAATTSAEIFTADPAAALVDSVVLVGDNSCFLIDAQFTAQAAGSLADMIDATGKPLETVFITHRHPDHVLGLAVLLDRFPSARAIAHPAIRDEISGTAQSYLDAMSSGAPAGAFADRIEVPEAVDGDTIEFDGSELRILGPMHGDTDQITPVHVPELDLLVASDLVYADTHVWVAENTTPDRIGLWRDNLNRLADIGASTIIPGHRKASSANDMSAIEQTRAYLDQWEKALANTSSADELRAAMMEGNEDLGLGLALDMGVGAVHQG